MGRSSFGDHGNSRVALRRDKRSNLILEVTGSGLEDVHPQEFPAGTVRQPDEMMEFADAAGGEGMAHGVVYRATRSKRRADGESHTTITYGLHTVEWRYPIQEDAAYTIEWVSGIPDSMIWMDNDTTDIEETYAASIGTTEMPLTLEAKASTRGGTKSIRLEVEGYEVIFRSSHDYSDEMIVYRPAAPDEVRRRVRECVSFLLGRPISYLGFTDYSRSWIPVRSKSQDAPVFKQFTKGRSSPPPYPLHEGKYATVLSSAKLQNALAKLMTAYKDMGFGELCWSYWFGRYAPVHMAPAHFGALIERLMSDHASRMGVSVHSLLDEGQYLRMHGKFSEWMISENLSQDVIRILAGKVSNLSQPPAAERLRRLADALGLATTGLEIDSWKHRNRSAHGSTRSDPLALILNATVQSILFARLIAALTGCADHYIDYYSYNHPIRPLSAGVPARLEQ